MRANFKFIVDRLNNGLWDDRIKACKVLGESGDPRAWEPLIHALHDHEVEVRSAACQALRQLRDPRSVEPIMALLAEEMHPPLRLQAIRALATHKDPAAAPMLIELLSDEEIEVRVAVCRALGEIGAVSATDALLEALADASRIVRVAVCEALGRLRQVRVIRPLMKQLGDFEPTVRKAVLEALRRLGENRFVDAYSQALLASSSDVDLLTHMAAHGDVRVVSPLLERLEDNWLNEHSRERIVEVLEALYPASKRRLETLFCTTDRARFEERVANPPATDRVRYVGCRRCGSTVHVISVDNVRAVLDEAMSRPLRFDSGILRVKWAAGDELFDFSEVEIGRVDDEHAARLCVSIGNDTDPFRRRLYAKAICYVRPTSRLSSNTRHMLRRTFAEVNQ